MRTLIRVQALALKLWHALRTDLVNSGGPHLHEDRAGAQQLSPFTSRRAMTLDVEAPLIQLQICRCCWRLLCRAQTVSIAAAKRPSCLLSCCRPWEREPVKQ